MPTTQEKEFFSTALRLMDTFDPKGHKRAEKYLTLVRRSPDGKIAWKEIPGLLHPRSNGGYAAALQKVCEEVIKIKLGHPRNPVVIEAFAKLLQLAKEVCLARQLHQTEVQRGKGLITYVCFKLSILKSLQDDATLNHTAAIELWKQAWATLHNNRDKGIWDYLLSLAGLTS